MKTGSIVFEHTSQKSGSLERIVQVTLEALKQGDFITALDQFNDDFAFIDHALELEFSAKDRVIEFFAERRRRFPEFERTDNIVMSGGNRIVSEWFLTAAKRGSLPESWMEVPICMRGASIVRIENGKITQWSDYYDQLQAGDYGVGTWLTAWMDA
jgi:limonene-1,2-epoxide hydrolase